MCLFDTTRSFLDEVQTTKVCSTKLSAADAKKFSAAVEQHYWYQLYLDDLPIWGMVGEAGEDGKKVSQPDR